MTITDAEWTADVTLAPKWQTKDPLQHLECRVKGETNRDALQGAQFILELFAKGRRAYIRALPEVASEIDFDSKTVLHHGYVRFSFLFEPGEWVMREQEVKPLTLGILQAST